MKIIYLNIDKRMFLTCKIFKGMNVLSQFIPGPKMTSQIVNCILYGIFFCQLSQTSISSQKFLESGQRYKLCSTVSTALTQLSPYSSNLIFYLYKL